MPAIAVQIDVARALALVETGLTYDDIAAELGVARSTLLKRLDEVDEPAHTRARLISAEAWLDRGLQPLKEALDKEGNIDASAARAYEQACARRAALRNPAYRESNKTEITGANGGPVQYQKIERLIVDSV